uniref:Uncharacterized protein n=1 Tax=Tetradesmus obliquus TaxID=3088 RepID=A0A383VDB5_TETOB
MQLCGQHQQHVLCMQQLSLTFDAGCEGWGDLGTGCAHVHMATWQGCWVYGQQQQQQQQQQQHKQQQQQQQQQRIGCCLLAWLQ